MAIPMMTFSAPTAQKRGGFNPIGAALGAIGAAVGAPFGPQAAAAGFQIGSMLGGGIYKGGGGGGGDILNNLIQFQDAVRRRREGRVPPSPEPEPVSNVAPLASAQTSYYFEPLLHRRLYMG